MVSHGKRCNITCISSNKGDEASNGSINESVTSPEVQTTMDNGRTTTTTARVERFASEAIETSVW